MEFFFLSFSLSFFLPLAYYAYLLLVQRIIVEFYDTEGHTHARSDSPGRGIGPWHFTWQYITLIRYMPLAGFEATIPESERPKTKV
jgi:hypothetical protein